MEGKGVFILEKIIDKITFIVTQNNTVKQNLENIVFGKNNEQIISCPIITQNGFLEMDEDNLSDDKLLNLQYLEKNNFKVLLPFLGTNNKLIDAKEFESKYSNKYFFDKKYFDSFVLNKIDKSGFHFEKFIIFDFDKNGFINDPQISFEPPIEFDPSNKELNFELFYYSCLNTCFFLSDSTGTKNIVVNPEYFKTIFPLNLDGDGKSRQLYDFNVIEKYFSNFIRNVRYGLRLVCRQSFIEDGGKESKYKYNEELFKGIKNPFYKTQQYIDTTKQAAFNLNRPSSFNQYKDKKIKDLVELKFTNLEYSILKEKSYILFEEKNSLNYRRIWTPLISVYSDKILNPYGSQIEGDTLLADIHNFIDDIDNVTINELKQKMTNIIDFKYVYERLIPVNTMSLLQNLDISSFNQKTINQELSNNKEDPALIANSLEKSFSSLLSSSLNDDKEY